MNKKQIIDELGQIVKTSYDINIINNLAKKDIKKLVRVSEKIYADQIQEIAQNIVKSKSEVVAVAGPSAAGKTTSCKILANALKKLGVPSVVVSMDDFFVPRHETPKLPDGSYDFENITAINMPQFKQFIKDLLKNNHAIKPIYDFATGLPLTNEEIQLEKGGVIIVEGLHALNPVVTKGIKLKKYSVYVSCESHFILGRELVLPAQMLRLMRRSIRDYHKRGNSLNTTFSWWNSIRKGEADHIKPYKHLANYLLDTTHIYEPLLYDFYLLPLLINIEDGEFLEIFQNTFNKTGSLKKDVIPKNSFLWEFLTPTE